MPYSRQDRINLNKNSTGIGTGTGTNNNLPLNSPELRVVTDDITGEERIIHYVNTPNGLKQSEFTDPNKIKEDGIPKWYISKEMDITSGGLNTGTHKALAIPASSYVLDLLILCTSTITAGSMDIDLGDDQDTDAFVDGWDANLGSNWIYRPGQSSSITESGKKTGKFYDTANTIDLKINTVASAGKLKILALILKIPIISSATATE